MTANEKKDILSVIRQYIGTEETAPVRLKDFLLLPEYKMLQDDQCFLILGGRGAGKTCLYNMFSSPEGFQSIMEDQNVFFTLSGTSGKSLKGYDRDEPFPTANILGSDLFSDEKAITAYWAGSLLFVLIAELKQETTLMSELQTEMSEKLYQVFSDINLLLDTQHWIPLLRDHPEIWEKAHRRIDHFLEQNHRKIYVTYDHLDRTTNEYNRLFPFIRTLLALWYAHITRWHYLRCKIFLRTDLFDNSNMLQFPDASKLKDHTMKLSWKPLALYQLFVKRMANSSSPEAPVVLSYLRKTPELISGGDSITGYHPTKSKEVMEGFIKNLIGEYMGGTPKKGMSYHWIPNHLQDANGVLAPRSF